MAGTTKTRKTAKTGKMPVAGADELAAGEGSARAEELAARMAASPASFPALNPEQGGLLETHFKTPAGELLERFRVARAGRELLAGDRPWEEIAASVGAAREDTFAAEFARQTALAPAEYRALRGASRFTLALPGSYLRERTLAYLGRDPGSLTLRVSGNHLAAAVRLAGIPALIRAEVREGEVRAEIEAGAPMTPMSPLPEAAAALAHTALLRLLGLGRHPEAFEARAAADAGLGPWVARQRGLRISHTPDPFDGLLWVILGQQITLAFAFTLRRRLIERAGAPLPGGLAAPPTPEAVANLDIDTLAGEQFSRRKAEYLIGTSRLIAGGELAIERPEWTPATRIERELLAVRGLGPWSVQYLLMRAYGFEDCVPVGDAGLTRALQNVYRLPARPGPAETLALMAPFAPYRSWATFHLWESIKTGA